MSPDLLNFLLTIGRVFSPLYSLMMRLRASLYAKGIIVSERLSLPVVSIGNLTMGGTGKTPVVMYVVRLLGKQYRPAVISRGYGGRGAKAINVVSDERTLLLGPETAGDEPVLLAQSLSGVPVITGAKRVETGRYVETNTSADLIVMDDGFQHLALARDLNLVLFSGDELLGSGWVFPGGVLREPFSALARADAFVVTGISSRNRRNVLEFKERLQREFPAKPLFEIPYTVKSFTSFNTEPGSCSVSQLQNKKLFTFCGIAKPESFFFMLREAGLQIGGTKAFADHHPFTANDLSDLCMEAQRAGCEGLLTTEKDFVKVKGLPVSMPVWVAPLIVTASIEFDQFVLDKVKAAK